MVIHFEVSLIYFWNKWGTLILFLGGITPIYKGHLESNVLNFNKTPPPAYHTLFSKQNGGKRKIVNGREYWITDERQNGPKLIPARAPSAMLFQYTN